jgi:hypothetical protein
MHVILEDIPKTLFSSPFSTFVSNNLQQGDCNGLSSWQRLMTYVFWEQIAVEVWVYIDDIYVFTNTIEEHKNVLEYVLKCLTDEKLYISPKKFRPYATRFNCLRHYQDKHGLHASTDKLELIQNWQPQPCIMMCNTFWGSSSTSLVSSQACLHIRCHCLGCAQTV